MYKIDINCDLGEGEDTEDCQQDALLMPYISSCNIACGGHAGNQQTIQLSLLNAQKHQLKIGAHPGYPDKDNFGRKSLSLSSEKLNRSLREQIDWLITIGLENNIHLKHIKLHGALYNDVEKDKLLASQIAKLFRQHYSNYKIVGLADGKLEEACQEESLEFIAEGFMDRVYLSNGQLTPRKQAGAVIQDIQAVINQAIALAKNARITTSDKQKISPKVETICLHGDNPKALTIIKNLTRAFKESGINIQ